MTSRRRTDENDAFVFAALREGGILGQKAIARMHRFGAAFLADIDNPVHCQITLFRRRGTDGISVIRVFDVQRFAVGFRVNRYRFDIQLAAGARDPNRDLAPVGNENAFKHVRPGVRREA